MLDEKLLDEMLHEALKEVQAAETQDLLRFGSLLSRTIHEMRHAGATRKQVAILLRFFVDRRAELPRKTQPRTTGPRSDPRLLLGLDVLSQSGTFRF